MGRKKRKTDSEDTKGMDAMVTQMIRDMYKAAEVCRAFSSFTLNHVQLSGGRYLQPAAAAGCQEARIAPPRHVSAA